MFLKSTKEEGFDLKKYTIDLAVWTSLPLAFPNGKNNLKKSSLNKSRPLQKHLINHEGGLNETEISISGVQIAKCT